MTPVSGPAGEASTTRSSNLVLSPVFRRVSPPLIVIGMHRSGTSLVSGMLSIMGVYMDPALSRLLADNPGTPPDEAVRRLGYGEASVFRRLNDMLLLCAGGNWRHVDPFLEQRNGHGFRRWCLLLMQHAALTSLRVDYMSQAPSHNCVWGWKDPRNSLTLPYWLRLFPEARILHVRRNTENVVDSLIRRDESFGPPPAPATPPGIGDRMRRVLTDPGYGTAAVRRRLGHLPADEPQSFDRQHYLRLADLYVQECVQARRLAAGLDHYMEVRYEDLVANPYSYAANLAAFAGVAPAANDLQRAASFVERPAAPRSATARPQGRRNLVRNAGGMHVAARIVNVGSNAK